MPEAYFISVAFVFGLLIGSFLNACAYRIPAGVSVAKGRSFCPACKAQIRGYDNIPLVSWVVLRGHCRDCGAPISWRYPLVEGLTAVLFAAVAALDGSSAVLFPHLLFVSTLVLVSDIDIAERIIPNVVVLPVAAIGLVTMTAINPGGEWRAVWLVSGLAAAGFLFSTAWIYERVRKVEAMGMGDVKLALCMGFFLGTAVVPALFIGFISGAVVGAVLIARGASARTAIPFGPFLAAGAIAALFWGQPLIDLYLRVTFPS